MPYVSFLEPYASLKKKHMSFNGRKLEDLGRMQGGMSGSNLERTRSNLERMVLVTMVMMVMMVMIIFQIGKYTFQFGTREWW